ncbi:hypothetical protein ACMFMG_007881 [Clarireedia jacksonii]
MAVLSALLAKRDFDDDDDYDCDYYGRCYSTWNSWGRWVALAVIVVAFILLAFALSCVNSRRRRRRGMAPMYGTAWMAPPPYGQHGQNQQYPNQPWNGPHAPPMYSPPGVVPQQTGNTFNSNDGYYGHHQYQGQENGIELQQPASAYQRGADNVYQAPMGPPPGKTPQGDGIIR